MKKSTLKFYQSIICLVLLFLCVKGNCQRLTVSANDSKILQNGNPITLRGVNFGNWLLWEGYMMNIENGGREKTPTQIRAVFKDLLGGDENKINAFETNWRNSYITSADFQQAKALGYNVVRIPFHYNMFWNGVTGAVKNDGFVWLDKAVNWAKANNIYVILCLHAAPGSQNPSYSSDNPTGDAGVNFWNDWNNVITAGKIWNHIANHYKNYTGNEWIAGYDLLNEPVVGYVPDNPVAGYNYGTRSSLMASYEAMTAQIRSVDSNHLIFAEGNRWGSEFWDMQKKWDSNLVFENHYYGGQGEANPNSNLMERKGIATTLHIPFFTGEFGENTADWVRDSRIDYEIANVGWAFWSWKRQDTERSVYSFGGSTKWNAICNYLKYASPKPSVADVETGLNEVCSQTLLANNTFVTTLQDRLRPNAPIGSKITLKNGDKYVSCNNSLGNMTCDRTYAQGWEEFTIVAAGDGKIALRDSNGKFVNCQNGLSACTSNSAVISGWEAFEWIEVAGQVALKGFNGMFLSSEGGASTGIICNRENASGWEIFNWATVSTSKIKNSKEKEIVSNDFKVFPNPVSDILFYGVPEGYQKHIVNIYDFAGKEYLSFKIDTKEATNSININALSDGAYILCLQNGVDIKSAIVIKNSK